MIKILQLALLASVGFAEELITLSNAAQSAKEDNPPEDGFCPNPEADVTLVSEPQDETLTTDWLKTEPCVCTRAAAAEEGGTDATWTADFPEEYKITRIRILSRYR